MGVDAGFGSSAFGIVVLQLWDNRVHCMFADAYERPSFTDMIEKIWQLKLKCKPMNIMADSANPEIVEAIKREIGESTDCNYTTAR